MFVWAVVNGFNQIYEGKNGRLLLVCNNEEERYNSAVIGLNYAKNGFWEVVTASPRKASSFKDKMLLYDKRKQKT